MATSLKNEFAYYIKNQDELVQKYLGKYVVIKESQVIGVFESEIDAIQATSEEHDMGTFFVQKCEPGSQNYTQNFRSRVIFA